MRFLILILSFFLLNSCVGLYNYPVPSRFKRAMNCYDSAYTGLDTLINIHGYYSKMEIRDKKGLYGYENGKRVELGIDTSFYNIMFYNDGIFIANIGFRDSLIEEGLTQMKLEGRTFSTRSYYQGTYKISGDTIKTQQISSGYSNVWFAWEVWYRIINKNTIQSFYTKHLALLSHDYKKQGYQPKFITDSCPAKFVYVENIPESDSWLKREAWFYCK